MFFLYLNLELSILHNLSLLLSQLHFLIPAPPHKEIHISIKLDSLFPELTPAGLIYL